MVKADWIKVGATVIDVGINRCQPKPTQGSAVGDCDFEQLTAVAGAITRFRAAVRTMTIAMLMANTVIAAFQAAIFPGLTSRGPAPALIGSLFRTSDLSSRPSYEAARSELRGSVDASHLLGSRERRMFPPYGEEACADHDDCARKHVPCNILTKEQARDRHAQTTCRYVSG